MNRLKRVDLPDNNYEGYFYSGNGKRLSLDTNGTVKKYIFDGLFSVLNKDYLNNTLVAYTKIPYAPGGIGGLLSGFDGTDTLFYHDSHLGNVNQLTDVSANLIQSYEYDGFGSITAENGSLTNQYLYKTKEYSFDTGLTYFGARYYYSLLGRFITPDPLGMRNGSNLYIYCNNDPVIKIDLWGLCAVDPNDWDGDGVPNDKDVQPHNEDSPQPKEFRIDSDGDGIVDAHDLQPENKDIQ